MAQTFNVVAPVFLVIGLGYIYNYIYRLEISNISRIYIKAFLPALVFNTLLSSTIEGRGAFLIFLALGLLIVTVYIINLIIGKLWKVEGAVLRAIQLSTVFMNAGSVGLPLILFAFGPAGLELGVIFLLFLNIFHYSVGILIADGSGDLKKSLKTLFSLPVPYAAVVALIIQWLKIPFPEFLATGVEFMSRGALPMAAFILGMQLTSVTFKRNIPELIYIMVIKLLLAPFVFFVGLRFLSFDPLSIGVLMLLAATPPSINSVIISVEYKANPELVSSANLSSTVISIFTLPLIISFIMNYVL